MYASGDEGISKERTAFRNEEKRYQLHREQTFLTRRNKKKGGPLVTRHTSLEDVVDLKDLREMVEKGGENNVHGIKRKANCANDVVAYEIPERPGCLLIPNALDLTTQRNWLVQSVTSLCEPPAETNHNVTQGNIEGLWQASLRGQWLVKNTNQDCDSSVTNRWSDDAPSTSGQNEKKYAQVLLEKLRWATLGPPYDWTKRVYKDKTVYSNVPEDIRRHCIRLAAGAGHPEFKASAGLVNYYRAGDALAGHVDDAEKDLSKPIVSFSLGSPCVFLIGGDTRDTKPVAVILRSGDAIVLSGLARKRFHGVPRVFVEDDGTLDVDGVLLKAPKEVSDKIIWTDEPFVAEYVRGGRVNVSVRDID